MSTLQAFKQLKFTLVFLKIQRFTPLINQQQSHTKRSPNVTNIMRIHSILYHLKSYMCTGIGKLGLLMANLDNYAVLWPSINVEKVISKA